MPFELTKDDLREWLLITGIVGGAIAKRTATKKDDALVALVNKAALDDEQLTQLCEVLGIGTGGE